MNQGPPREWRHRGTGWTGFASQWLALRDTDRTFAWNGDHAAHGTTNANKFFILKSL